MGCQRHIATQIRQQSGHYLLAVKKNQKELFDDITCAFKANKPLSVEENWEYDHGRFEIRKCSILSVESTMDEEIVAEWSGLRTIIKIESNRIIKEKKTVETRYYISDENESNSVYFSYLVRGHWGIENHLHWQDVTFKEDKCRVRTGNAPENLATLRKLALQIISEHKDKLSLQKRRVRAAYDTEYMNSLFK
jgi:predicted transposase YbfD/YdcC